MIAKVWVDEQVKAQVKGVLFGGRVRGRSRGSCSIGLHLQHDDQGRKNGSCPRRYTHL